MHTKITIATTAILVTVAGVLGTFTMSGTAFATTIPDKDDGASGLAPGENKGQEFPGPETFTPGQIIGPDNPGETDESAPGRIIGPDSPGETDESAPGEIIGPDNPEGDSPGKIIGPDNPSETPGHEGQESGIIGPD